MMGRDILDAYEKRFLEMEGDPSKCNGVQWSDLWLKENPSASGDAYIDTLSASQRIEWIIPMLRLCWDILSTAQRLVMMQSVPGWALKTVCGWKVFPNELSEPEKAYMRTVLTNRRAFKALDRLNA